MSPLTIGLGLRQGVKPPGETPVPPAGYVFLVNRNGAYLLNRDGAYLMRPGQ